MRISVVVPVLDEERIIEARLRELSDFHEVIVVDGGSTDRTRALAAPHATVIEAPRGRAVQLNAGARVATGDVLLFLHADVSLPRGVEGLIEAALRDPRVVAGAFKTWTVLDPPRWWAPALHVADLRSRLTRYPYGDQAIFVRREVFEAVGGFPEQRLMEDLELSRRLRRVGSIALVDARVTVSGRRFLARPLRTMLAWNTFPALYRWGVSPETLERLYGNPR